MVLSYTVSEILHVLGLDGECMRMIGLTAGATEDCNSTLRQRIERNLSLVPKIPRH